MSVRALRSATTVLAALLLAASTPAFAQLPEMPLGKWWKRPRVVEKLKIKPEQQDRLDDIFGKNRRVFIDLKAEVDRRTVDLEELLAKKESDPVRIAASTDALEQAKGRLGKTRTMRIVEMKGVLTDEQWQRILELRDEWRRERVEERRGGALGSPRVPGRQDRRDVPPAATPLPRD